MKKSHAGFTLAEMLVVLGILSILGLIILTIFTRSLRGTNKTQVILSIKENGQSVLENIDKNIRGADNLVCVSSDPKDTLIIFKEGVYTRYRIIPKGNEASICGKNGCIAFDNPKPTAEETTPELFINRVCTPTNSLDSTSTTILTDTDFKKGVSVTEGSFTLDKLGGFKDSINISFVLEAPSESPEALRGQIDPVTFETTVQLR